MKSLVINLLVKLFENFFGKHIGEIDYQYLYEKFHYISLKGKNMYPGDILDNGEKRVLELVHKNCDSNAIIFDVGANIGKYSLELSKYFSLNQKIFSFEPSKSSYEELKSKTNLIDNIRCFNLGMSMVKEEKYLFFDHEKSGLSSLYQRDIQTKLEKKEKIKLTTIDIFCKENNISKIDFLKLDVEGHEIAVLKGCEKMIESINFIQFEFGGCNISSRTFFKDFFDLLNPDFEINRILIDGLYPIKNYNEILECFLHQNYLAIKRK